jgi:hypothetical protein
MVVCTRRQSEVLVMAGSGAHGSSTTLSDCNTEDPGVRTIRRERRQLAASTSEFTEQRAAGVQLLRDLKCQYVAE